MRHPENLRALRRADRDRLRKNRRWRWRQDHSLPGMEKAAGKLIETPTPCSCCGCGNPRNHFGERTMAERRLDQVDFEAQGWDEYNEKLRERSSNHPDPWTSY